MRRLALGCLLGTLLSITSPVSAEPDHELARLAWMEGTWAGTMGRSAIEETWSSPSGGAMVGMQKATREGRLVSFDFMRIVAADSGRVAFLASPNGAAVTRFVSIELTDQRVVFENPTHDFPQRVLYWIPEDGRLHARIEGSMNGVPRAIDWVWTKRTPAAADAPPKGP